MLSWNEIEDPVPSPGHALVRLKAAGVNFADVYRRRGKYHMDATPPWMLGYEGAGVVAAIEYGDHGFPVGTRVGFADTPRANAELVAVPIDKLVTLPTDITFHVAAALLLQGLTAQYLIRDSYLVRAVQSVVVHAAASGVGLLLAQMLKRLAQR